MSDEPQKSCTINAWTYVSEVDGELKHTYIVLFEQEGGSPFRRDYTKFELMSAYLKQWLEGDD